MNSKPEAPIHIVLVILEDRRGLIYLQFRDQIEGIVNPGKWGLFGGHVEPGETPAACARREIEEELTVQLDPRKLRAVGEWRRKDGAQHYFLYRYPVGNELDNAELTEGERFAAFSPAQIGSGTLEGSEVVSYHLDYLKQYWEAA